MCLGSPPGPAPDAAEADGPAELPAECALLARQSQRFLEIALGLRGVARLCQDVTLDPEHLGHVEGFAPTADLGDGLVDRTQRLFGLARRCETLSKRRRKDRRHDPMPCRIQRGLASTKMIDGAG